MQHWQTVTQRLLQYEQAAAEQVEGCNAATAGAPSVTVVHVDDDAAVPEDDAASHDDELGANTWNGHVDPMTGRGQGNARQR